MENMSLFDEPKKAALCITIIRDFMVLLGLVDEDYKFIWADLGPNCAATDAQIFADSKLKEAMENNVISSYRPTSK